MEIAGKFALTLEPGSVVGLIGDLGAGKTHFVKGMANALGINPKDVASPTFTLLNIYKGVPPGVAIELYHFDWYRLKNSQEIYDIGAEEYLYGRRGISVIEWYDPQTFKVTGCIEINLNYLDEFKREIIIP